MKKLLIVLMLLNSGCATYHKVGAVFWKTVSEFADEADGEVNVDNPD